MDWSKVYSYCERGGDPSFWAEPLNAISNGAFVIAGLIGAWQLMRSPRKDHALFEWLLVVLVICIGIGSFMFHTYATVWAIPFDTIPISLFMLAYLGYALRRFAGAPWIVVIAALVGFYFTVKYAQGIQCSNELLPMTRGAGKRCFNGTLGYTPAFAALVLVGGAAAGAGPSRRRLSVRRGVAFPRRHDLPHHRSGSVHVDGAGRARRRHALLMAHPQRALALRAAARRHPAWGAEPPKRA